MRIIYRDGWSETFFNCSHIEVAGGRYAIYHNAVSQTPCEIGSFSVIAEVVLL